MTKVKLCGLMTPDDAFAANTLIPEYVGFVFAPSSRRCISVTTAKNLREILKSDIKTVGVFVNDTAENISQLCENRIIDVIQLHGNENEEYIRHLRSLTGKPIIKAFKIDSESDVLAAENSSADYVLLDSGRGGTGKAFDWSLVKQINRDYFLAGGLDSENVAEAIAKLNPYAVDVSSGIETDGRKDANKMRAFVSAVKGENVNNDK